MFYHKYLYLPLSHQGSTNNLKWITENIILLYPNSLQKFSVPALLTVFFRYKERSNIA